ncbi:DUF2235 domain-containing protein [Methylopila sp. 73B]|uniref:DUF2235 domain-containing protein n=1 Tax=Methylopila sp. 73B TaxID=1120792 RepID=UPI00035EB7BC|nr:DUF2235 domain-containing protein [Methylopila sp. 73B]
MTDRVVCCDGTWNTPDDVDDGLPAATNVHKIYSALADPDPRKRYYHPGVGTGGGWWTRVAGGAAGVGLTKNVKSAYRWLAEVYEPGDRIWLFGFSRGAFTVRSLSGMISRCGLLNLEGLSDDAIWAAVDGAFDDYRARKDDVTSTKTRPLKGVALGQPAKGKTPIHFIGVWDTVGALGIPDDMALLNLIDDPSRYEFHDTDLSPNVVHARHAIAIDERRQSFTPTLWSDTPPKQNLTQRWFPGVHADGGGGYGQTGLSDGALAWMITEAKAEGLAFRAGAEAQLKPDARGVLHDSRTGVFKTLKSRPREVPSFADAAAPLHASARDRHENPPLTQLSYWPTTTLPKPAPKAKAAAKSSAAVDVFAREPWNATGLFLEAGATYAFAATGQWLDKSIPSGPAGSDDGDFHLGEAVHALLAGWGQAEQLYKTLTGNQQADFWLTKREDAFGWFALVGVVASGAWIDEGGKEIGRPLRREAKPMILQHETFLIGAKATFTPRASGYLYCFANDTWQTYDNNSGSVRLTVTRT